MNQSKMSLLFWGLGIGILASTFTLYIIINFNFLISTLILTMLGILLNVLVKKFQFTKSDNNKYFDIGMTIGFILMVLNALHNGWFKLMM